MLYNYNTADSLHETTTYDGEKVISNTYIAFGDYDNSCAVERANVRYLLENYKDQIALHEKGSYGSEKIWLYDTTENRELLESLDSYPCFDDEIVSEIEHEIEEEYIKDNDDIYRLYTPEPLKSVLDTLDIRCIIPEIYYQATEKANMYFEVEAGGSGWIDLKKLAPTYNDLIIESNPAISALLNVYEHATLPAFPLDFYEDISDMVHHKTVTGQRYTVDEVNHIINYAVELENNLKELQP